MPENRVEPDSRYTGFSRAVFGWLSLTTVWAIVLTVVLVNQADSIQQQRREGYLLSCADQNERRADALRKLDGILAAAPDPALAEASRKPTIVLINALVPYKDCKKLAKERVR